MIEREHDTTMTLEHDERARPLSYAPPDADTLFPMPEVSPHALASWKSSPMTHALITLVHHMRHDELSAGFRGDEDQFLLRKGRVEAFDRLLGEIDQLEAEILRSSEHIDGNEDSDDDDSYVSLDVSADDE